MRIRLPSSRGSFKLRFSLIDTFWACVSPLLALYVRDAPILNSYEGVTTIALYCGVSLAFSLIAYQAFRLRDGMTCFFSVHDALNVVKAVAIAALLTSLVLFTFTRLDGIPRSTPLIHALILAAGLIIARAVRRMYDTDGKEPDRRDDCAVEHIIMIGSTRLSSLYIEFLKAYSADQRRVIAVLDDQVKLIGSAISGVPVLASPEQLQPVIEEFAVHGIRTDRVIIGGEADLLPEDALREVRRICEQHEIGLDYVPRLIGLQPLPAPEPTIVPEPTEAPALSIELPRYFSFKRILDFIAALAMVIILLPLLILAAGLVLFDVGLPLLFWQQRIGHGGRNFLLQKLRTLRPPFDWHGQPIPEDQRMSWIGHLLRETRIDELPQLLNVLVGDMSLIGPRPLLPVDQPANPTVRLMVRPGITGWAQVNGATLLTPNEKDALDEWYIRNASLWLDLRIIVMTLRRVIFRNQTGDDRALADARAMRNARHQGSRSNLTVNGQLASQRLQRGRDVIEGAAAFGRPYEASMARTLPQNVGSPDS